MSLHGTFTISGIQFCAVAWAAMVIVSASEIQPTFANI
jgi:hypothetical protein